MAASSWAISLARLLQALLALTADESRQLNLERILLAAVAFTKLATHSAFALVD